MGYLPFLNRRKNVEKGWIGSLAWVGTSPALRLHHSWFLDLWTPIGTYIGSPGSHSFDFELEWHHQLSCASTLWKVDCEASQPPYFMEPFAQNKSFSIYLWMSYLFCFSGEPWLIKGVYWVWLRSCTDTLLNHWGERDGIAEGSGLGNMLV